LTHTTIECQKLSASEAPKPGRHHIGTPGDIISECLGNFVGIRTIRHPQRRGVSACRPDRGREEIVADVDRVIEYLVGNRNDSIP
jgi:hypothetical protein